MYDKLGWMTVNQLAAYHTILAVYRIRRSKEPAYNSCSLDFEIRLFFADSDPTIKSLDTDSAVGSKIADPVSRSEI